jgi:hypothetical protein
MELVTRRVATHRASLFGKDIYPATGGHRSAHVRCTHELVYMTYVRCDPPYYMF